MTPEPTVREACARCGTFSEALERKQRVCAPCMTRLRDEERQRGLYPPWFLWTVGVLVNGAISSGLAAVNWKRVGEAERARSAWVLAALCVLMSLLVMFVPAVPAVALLIGSVSATRQALAGWPAIYQAHVKDGGRRANLWLAGGIIVGVFATVILGIAVITVMAIADPDR